jgi:hypothetical protein
MVTSHVCLLSERVFLFFLQDEEQFFCSKLYRFPELTHAATTISMLT